MEAILNLLKNQYIGNISSILGLLVSLIGFIITIFAVFRSKAAAEAAKQAADATKARIFKFDCVMECSNAISALEEIRRLYRAEAIIFIPDRLTLIKRAIITVRTSSPLLRDEDQTKLQSAISQIATCEKLIEEAISSKGNTVDLSRLLKITSKLIESLTEILHNIRNSKE